MSKPAPTVGGKTIEEALGGISWADKKKKAKRIKQGLSTKIKLNTPPQNRELIKEFIGGKNDEFNWLNKEQRKEVLNILDDQMKKSDFASGGRIGFAGGLLVKGANWFIKSGKELLKEAANPGPWSRFSKMGAKEKKTLIADTQEMIKRLEGGDPIPEYLLEDIVANPKFKLKRSKATDPDLVEVENLVEGYSRLKNARANKFRGEIRLSPNDPSGAYSRNASSALDDYELFTPVTKDMFGKTWKKPKNWINEERAKIKKTQEEIGPAPSSRHPEYRSMVQIRKGLEDRLTALDITEELGGNIKMFDKLRMHNYPTYKNTLDKRDWLMPPGGLKKREAFVIDLGHHTLPPKKHASGGRVSLSSGGLAGMLGE